MKCSVCLYSLMRSFVSAQVNHLRCLCEFVEAQTVYYNQCHKYMQELQRELARWAHLISNAV